MGEVCICLSMRFGHLLGSWADRMAYLRCERQCLERFTDHFLLLGILEVNDLVPKRPEAAQLEQAP